VTGAVAATYRPARVLTVFGVGAAVGFLGVVVLAVITGRRF